MPGAAQQRTNPIVSNRDTASHNRLTQPQRPQEPANTETVAVGNLGKAALELQRELEKCKALSHLPPEAREFLAEAKKHLTTLQAYQAQLENSGAETRIVTEFTEYNARAQANGVQQPLSGEAIQYLSLYRVAGALLRGMVSAAKVGEYQTQLDNTPLGQRATEAVVGKSGVSLSLEAVRDLHLKHIREELTTHVRELTKLATAVASTATNSVTVQQQGEYIQSSIKYSRDTAWRFGETNLANIQGKVNAQRANREANFIALPGAASTLGGAAFIPLGFLGLGAGGVLGLTFESAAWGGGKFSHEAIAKVLQAANGYRTGGLTEQQATAQAKQGLTEAATSGARAAALTVVTGAPFFLAPRAVTALTRSGVSAESARFITGTFLGGAAGGVRATFDGVSQREAVGATGIGALAGAVSSLSTPLGGVSGVGINLLIQAGGLFAFSYARDGKVTFSGLTQTAGYMLPGITAGISAAHAPIAPRDPSNPTGRFKEFVRSLVPEVQQPQLAYAGGVATGPGRAAKHSDELQSGVSLRTGEWSRPNAGYPGQNGKGSVWGATPTTPSAWTVTNRVHESSITTKRYEESLKQNQLSKKIKTVIENLEKGILPGYWEQIPGSPGLLKAKIHASDKNGRVVFSYDEKRKRVTIFAIYVKDHHGGGKTDLGEQRLHDYFRTIARGN